MYMCSKLIYYAYVINPQKFTEHCSDFQTILYVDKY